MITRNTDYSIQRLRGLSTDTKPTDVPNGSEFREMDTGKKFLYSAAGTEWIEQPCCGGGSGGGGSVEPLIVEIGPLETETTGNLLRAGNTIYMNKTAGTIYEAYMSGVPVVLIRQEGDVVTNVFNLTQTVKYKTGDIFAYVFIYREVVENEVFSRTFTANSEQEYPSMTE